MLICFRAVKLQTKQIVFEAVIQARDSGTLEQLKELSSRRKLIEGSINSRSQMPEAIAREMSGGLTSQTQQDLQKLEHYLPLLENLVAYHDSILNSSKLPNWVSELKIRWTSALSASCILKLGSKKFYSIDNLRFELGMSLFLYGSIMRERAFETLSTDLVEAATLFRKAAGVFDYLAQRVLPPLRCYLPKDRADQPPEATSSLSNIMSLICLADAQAATVKRAEEKENSSNLLAKLHYGVTQTVNDASSILRSMGEGNDVSARLMEFIGTSSTLHELRSQRYLAEHLQHEERIGAAVALLRRALAKAKKERAPKSDTWRAILNQEISDVEKRLKRLENENHFVWNHKIPAVDELPNLDGTVIVNAIPYEPQRWERTLVFSI